jgi:RNA:NAD 2'-phosphotransferase (TPT1/KptA family)
VATTHRNTPAPPQGRPVTPADVAKRIAARRGLQHRSQDLPGVADQSATDDPAARLRLLCPELPWLLKQLGISNVSEVINEWVRRRNHDWVSQLLSMQSTGHDIAEKWQIHMARGASNFILIEEFIFEYWLSTRASLVALNLPKRYQYDKTLQVCRQRVALSLYAEAREVTWRRPFIYTRALKISNAYLHELTENSDLTSPEARHQFAGRLGVAVVLIARFENVPEDDLREAVEKLLSSVTLGNPASEAVPYILEGMIRLYDLCGEIETLARAVMLSDRYATQASQSAPWQLNMAEIWLRIADEASTSSGQRAFLNRAEGCVRLAETIGLTNPLDRVRHHVAFALFNALSQFLTSESVSSLGIRGLKNPFGLYEHLAELRSPADSPMSAMDIVVNALRLATATDTEPIFRRVFADALSARALDPATTVRECIALLQEALRVRRGPGRYSQLDDEPSRFGTARDILLLGRMQRDEMRRVEGLKLLVTEAVSDAFSCIPLVMLGQEMETNGPLSADARTKLRALLAQSHAAHELMEIVSSNSVDSVYEEAARRAIISPDLSRRHLGGRGNAVATEDYLRLSNEVFVFKATSRACYERDLARTEALSAWIKEQHLDRAFGFVDHLAQTEADQDDPMFSGAGDVLTVRRFQSGSTLADAMRLQPDLSGDLLAAACRFLAIIQTFETARAGTPTGVRSELRKKEFGRWLRDGIKADNTAEIFDAWWGQMAGVPPLRRRDAHAFNWLVSATHQVLAIDLEATGWRPAGYELAQLTDDFPALPVSDPGWTQRKKIVELYASTLTDYGVNVTYLSVWRSYTASLVARAVRGLTDPTGDERFRSHAEQLLQSIAEESTMADELRLLAKQLLVAWARRRGIGEAQLLPRIGHGRRRRISRALSYHLRHDQDILADDEGWVSAESLSEALRAAGLGVSTAELISVASAIDETRFEVRDSNVRARYGHSRPVNIDYESPAPPMALYHATSMVTLNAIFQEEQGLKPMERQWVHLSERWDLAVRAGRRHGPPALLEVTPARASELAFYNAGGTTWLARSISPAALHVVPVFCVFLWNHERR